MASVVILKTLGIVERREQRIHLMVLRQKTKRKGDRASQPIFNALA